jgi:hypoxanthine phosphoribosyltransferase
MVGGQYPGAQMACHMPFPMEMDYIHATRYQGKLRGKTLQWRALPAIDPRGRDILVVDDILDEGITLQEIVGWFEDAGAASVHTAVLVEKDRKRTVPVKADIVGLRVPDRYVFGCGMDYKGYWRNLEEIYAVGETT